jgi:hypothetical protein
MNEKFKQLSLMAGGSHYPSVNPQLQQRFAELVIAETLQAVRAGLEFGPSMEQAVEQYFGIKL